MYSPSVASAVRSLKRRRAGSVGRPNKRPRLGAMTMRIRAPPPMVRMSRPELKGVDTVLDIAAGSVLATTNTNGASFVLNLIQPGNGSWNRVGNKVQHKSVRIRARVDQLYTDATTTGNIVANTLRMVVVWDQQPSSGSIPTFDTIFGKTVQDGTESTEFYDSLRYDNTGRFKVLSDSFVDSNPALFNGAAGSTDQVNNTYYCDKMVNLSGLTSVYSGQSAPQTIADISTGAIYIFFRAAANDTANRWQVDGVARLRYYDK